MREKIAHCARCGQWVTYPKFYGGRTYGSYCFHAVQIEEKERRKESERAKRRAKKDRAREREAKRRAKKAKKRRARDLEISRKKEAVKYAQFIMWVKALEAYLKKGGQEYAEFERWVALNQAEIGKAEKRLAAACEHFEEELAKEREDRVWMRRHNERIINQKRGRR